MSITHSNGLTRGGRLGSGASAGTIPTYAQGTVNLNPLVYWRFNETGGVTATDASGQGRDGTYTGGITLGGTPSPIRDTGGKFITDDGVNGSYVTIADAAWQRPQNGVTFSIWANPTSLGGGSAGRLFDKATNTAAAAGYGIALVSSNRLDVLVNSAADVLTGNNYFTFGTWVQVVVTISDVGVVRIYKNGVIDTVGTTNPLSGVTTINPLRVGGLSAANTNSWDGKLDEATIFGYVLTPDQILKQYNLGL